LKTKTFILIALSSILLSIIWIALTPILFPPVQSETSREAPFPGFSAPDFTLTNLDGEAYSLSDFKNRPVLVFIWASWCSVCKSTMPGLQKVYTEYAALGFEIMAVNTTYQDNLTSAVNYFTSQNFSYLFLLDQDGSVSQTYQVHALPTAILVDPTGMVHDVVIGSGMSPGLLRAQLDEILEESE